MQCPKCDNPISEGIVHGEAVEKCKKCGGIWIATGEMRAFFERILEDEPVLRGRKVDPSKARPIVELYKQGRDCPSCGQQMTKTYYAYDSGIPIEHCEPCGGTWVDKSRIDQLAKYIRDETAPIVYRDATGEAVHYEHKEVANIPAPIDSPWLMSLVMLVSLAVLVYAGYRLYPVYVAQDIGNESRDWIQVDGTLLDWSAEETTVGRGNDSTWYVVHTRYQYDYEGETYENDTTWPNGDDFMTREKSHVTGRGITRRLSDDVIVFVDPDEPSRSALNRGTNGFLEDYVLPRFRRVAIGAGVVFGIAVVLLIRALVIRRTRAT